MRCTFTFGADHIHPQTGESLAHKYIQTPELLTSNNCRGWMYDRFGTQWASQYHSPTNAGAVRYNLTEVTWDESKKGLFSVFGHKKYEVNIRCTEDNPDEFPKDEITNGIVHIDVSSHGDDRYSFNVRVIATTPLRGEEVYQRTHDLCSNMYRLYDV